MSRRPTETPREDKQRDFEERWRQWSARPPERSPQTAARQVVDRLERRERQEPRESSAPMPRRWSVPTLAATAAVTAGVWLALELWVWAPVPEASSPVETQTAVTPPMEDGVVLMWLDADTPLYMTFAPPATLAGADEGEES